MKIKTKNKQVDVKSLLKQIDREEKRWRKLFDSGKYPDVLKDSILKQLENLGKLREKLMESETTTNEQE